MFHYFVIDTSQDTLSDKKNEQMNDATKKYVDILHLTWECPTLLWMFKALIKVGETRNSLNACFYCFTLPFLFLIYMSTFIL